MYKKIINRKLFIPLSGFQLTQKLPNSKIIDYNDLHKQNSIIDLFDESKCVFLLYIRKVEQHGQLKTIIGHWVALFLNKGNKIHFFDPYGFPPDDKIYFQQSNIDIQPVLKKMLDQYGNYTVNKTKFQNLKAGYETCGRWCTVRMYFNNKSHKQFKDYINLLVNKTKLSPDEIIIKLFDEID